MNHYSLSHDQEAAFASFVAQLRNDAEAAGISLHTIEQALSSLSPSPTVLERDTSQPEHALTAGAYCKRLVTDNRIQTGRARLRDNALLFDKLEAAYGVPSAILLAIWGIESNFGADIGAENVIQCLASLGAMDTRRQSFWQSQLLAALRIIDTNSIAPERLVGSWAGAMGHTQFMPTTYLEHAVDSDGDDFCDIWQSPADGLASAANYLKNSGWSPAQIWGAEVRISLAFDFTITDPFIARSWSKWREAGIELSSSNDKLPDFNTSTELRLVLPAGCQGPAFLVTTNFDAILTYNRSTIYALSVGILADAIAETATLQTPWPAETALNRAERIELQERLTAAGLNTNGIDGILGQASLQATRMYQLRHGRVADGHANAELLRFMRTQTHDTN